MFLAWNEIKYSKLKYILVIGVMFLISYLVFFLTGLAYGLAESNRSAVDKWQADAIILSEDSNSILGTSILSKDTMDSVDAIDKASLNKASVVIISDEKNDGKVNATILAIQPDEFLMPNVIEGTVFSGANEVIVNENFKTQYGYQIGDEIEITDAQNKLVISGFTDKAELNVSPVIYMAYGDYNELFAVSTSQVAQPQQSTSATINAIVIKAQDNDLSTVSVHDNNLQLISIGDFIQDLPGYQAQNLTFGIMIGFLIVISAVVVGIFIYVLTMQKRSMFGILKAQGISNAVLSRSVYGQTFLLAVIGIGAGLLLTVITSFVLPPSVPYENNWLFYIGAAGLMLVFSLLGAFSSVLSIAKITPLEAMNE